MSGATPVQRVQRAQTVLAGTVLVAAVLWSGAAALGALALIAAASLAGLPPALAGFAWPLALVSALSVVGVALWRGRAVWSLERVALWLEEHAPDLKYALVTAVDPRYIGPALVSEGRAALIDVAGRADFEAIVRRSAGRTLGWAAIAVVITGTAARFLQATDIVRALGRSPRAAAVARPLGNRLARLRAEVVPPAYSGLPRRVVSDPTNVAALYGTAIRFLGDGPPEGVTAIVDRDTIVRDTIPAGAAGDGWAVPVPMPKLPGLIRFRDRTYHRAVVLEPLADSVPRVFLRAPVHDTTWRWDRPPHGDLVLEADIEDDYGIDAAYFEVLVSTGGAENFETKDRSTARVRFGGRKKITLRATISYAALGVGQGTVIHARAVAYDNNTVADSAGKGVSETRTLRVATKEESDTASIAAADPLPVDSLWIGQRVLNARTDTLIRVRRQKVSPQDYQDSSIAYSGKQELIHGRVENVIAMLEDDGAGGHIETEASRLLRAATEEMFQARLYLAIGMPDSAYVPPKSPMKEALRLLDLARKAQKYYLRGNIKIQPVDVAAARLKGDRSLTGNAADRTGRPIPDDLRRTLRRRLAAMVPYVVASPDAAIDSLMLIRAAALRGAPGVAAALQEAIDAAHEGKSVAVPTALARAQRLLDPPSQIAGGPADWGSVSP